MTGGISDEVRARVRALARDRRGFCQSPQHLVVGQLEVEHIIPKGRGGADDEDHLWLACRLCNNFKGTQTERRDPDTGQRVRLFHPRRQRWSDHFAWSEDGTRVLGLAPCGCATVLVLQLNSVIAITVRRFATFTAGTRPLDSIRLLRRTVPWLDRHGVPVVVGKAIKPSTRHYLGWAVPMRDESGTTRQELDSRRLEPIMPGWKLRVELPAPVGLFPGYGIGDRSF